MIWICLLVESSVAKGKRLPKEIRKEVKGHGIVSISVGGIISLRNDKIFTTKTRALVALF